MNQPKPLFRCTFCHRVAERCYPQCSACGAESSYVPAPPDATRPAGSGPGFPSPHGAFPQAPTAWPVPYGARPNRYGPLGVIQGGYSGPINPYGHLAGRPGFNPVGLAPKATAVPLASLPDVPVPRIKLFGPIDYVLGGGSEEELGSACATVVQLAGDPGGGKSTLLLQCLGQGAKTGPVVYGVGEEGGSAIRNRAKRLGIFEGEAGAAVAENLLLLETRTIEDFLDTCRQVRPVLAVFDSEQIAQSRVMMYPPRSAAMVTYVTEQCFRMAHDPAMGGIVVFLICQIVKDGTAAGPKATEHWIDASVYLDTRQGSDMRTLSSTKNRNGPGMRQALLTMTPLGLVPWEDKHPDRAAARDLPAPTTQEESVGQLHEQKPDDAASAEGQKIAE